MFEFTTAIMLKLAEVIWHAADNLVDHDAVLELINWNCVDCDASIRYSIDADRTVVVIWDDGKEEKKNELCSIYCKNHFQFFGLVMFELSEGNNFNLSKQFLREARITLAKLSTPRDAIDLNQQSVEQGQVCCTTARLKPDSKNISLPPTFHTMIHLWLVVLKNLRSLNLLYPFESI